MVGKILMVCILIVCILLMVCIYISTNTCITHMHICMRTHTKGELRVSGNDGSGNQVCGSHR